MAIVRLITGKSIPISDDQSPAPTVFGVMYKTTGLVLPGNKIDLTIIPWARVDSFTLSDQLPDDMNTPENYGGNVPEDVGEM